jgi:hypothetical protein
MPGGNQTGPRGLGPKTGRGMGNCSPESGNRNFYGRGFRGRYYQNDNSIESLKNEKKILEERLKAINSELDK